LDLDKLLEQVDAILASAPLVRSEKEEINEDPLEACLAQFGEDLDLDKLLEQVDAILEFAPLVSSENEETVVPKALKKELEPLTDKLTYKFLGPLDSLPAIIAPDLVDAQEEKSLDVLREHKESIGWHIEDKEPQLRLNPAMQEVERAEVIIYPIFDSKWVSPIHVMPMWVGLTGVKNKHDECVPNRIQSGWRAWISYRKLHAATRKDYFSRPFIDPMVEYLAQHEYLRL